MDADLQTCANCAYRDFDNAIVAPCRVGGRVIMTTLAPCLRCAVDADAGDSVTYMAETGHCLNHEAAFRASDAFRGDLDEIAAYEATCRQTDRRLAAAAW